MFERSVQRPLAFKAVALLPVIAVSAACGSPVRKAKPTVTPEAASKPTLSAPAPQPSPVQEEDPVIILLAQSERHFKAGEQELEAGHVAAAKQEFDKSLNVLLESPYGGRTEPRIREHFDRLVDRISAYEVKALADGDGFTEQKNEPASIDQLLAVSATLTPAPTAATEESVANDLQTVIHDVPIPLNNRVLSFIELFQGRLHDFIQEGLQRGSTYLPMIQNVFRAEGLPLDLAYVPLIESAFKPTALSRAKARGVWQFMRGTALENGLRQDWYIDERSDPEKATVAAARYLTTLSKMFDGDWHLALASYNGGPGRVQRAMRRTRLGDFWKLSARSGALPRETRDYVPMILAAIVIARNPAQYGFEFEPASMPNYDSITLPKPVDLRRVAEWADTTIDEIQALNPELRRWTTPVGDTSYTLKVPAGSSDLVRARMVEAADTELASLNWHVVKRGETLSTIAKKLRVSRTDLAEANYLRTSARLNPGQKLIVPREATVLMAARTDRPVPVADSRSLVADEVVPAVASSDTDRVKTVYRVKRGDTLSSIARLFETTVASLKSWNRMSGTQIRVGQRLTIYRLAN